MTKSSMTLEDCLLQCDIIEEPLPHLRKRLWETLYCISNADPPDHIAMWRSLMNSGKKFILRQTASNRTSGAAGDVSRVAPALLGTIVELAKCARASEVVRRHEQEK